MEFKVSSTTVDGSGVLLVSVEGELDIATADRLGGPAEVAVAVGCPLIVDLSECVFIDSTGLRALLHAHRALAEAGEQMAVLCDGQVRKMLSVTAIDVSIRVFDRRDDALSWLGTERTTVSDRELSVPVATNGGPSSASRLP